MGIGIQLHDYVSPLPSVIRFATQSSTTTRNDGMTEAPRPDSVQLAREYARMNIHLQPPTFSGFTEYPADTTNGQRGNGGHGGMHLNFSLERGGLKIVVVSRTFLIC